MTTNSRLPFLLGFFFFILGTRVQAYPLEVGVSPGYRHGGSNALSEWQETYNLTTGDCPFYFENIPKEQVTTRYACQLFCTGQYENSTEFQCLPLSLNKEQAKSQGLLYVDDQGGFWSPGRCHCGRDDKDDEESIAKRQAKQPLDITQKGYTMTSAGTVNNPVTGIEKWEIASQKSKKVDNIIDKLGYKPGQNTLYVFEAWNKADETKRRLKLRDIAVGWYSAKADQPLANLNSIYLQTVVEDTTHDAMWDIREELCPNDDDSDVTVYASDTEPKRKNAFRRLLTETKFGNGFRKMLEEYAALQGKAVVAFKLYGEPYYMDLEIVFSGSDSGLDEPPEATQQ